ncbi:vacuolar fusion protein MON1 homolog A-like [Paramacrobiotus metropolitanus]|uniref:vacuolar fusion protein MON1 homolog A-like n=1 Tax=Paramacrobiotus metropolitanus TaxID=2943436 RepID=UPI00244599ED|nr:vacuolar fusion protein MON1 homolog A-like [Paramacrobiotus metropolitanus]
MDGLVLDEDTSHNLSDDFTEHQYRALGALERLSPGLLTVPCFDVASSPSTYSHLTEHRASFSRRLHHSSGCISEIRASTIEVEAITVTVERTVHDSEQDQHFVIGDAHEDISEKSPRSRKGSLFPTVESPESGVHEQQENGTDVEDCEETVTHSSDSVDGHFGVTCTSAFIPRDITTLRHSATAAVFGQLENERNSDENEKHPEGIAEDSDSVRSSPSTEDGPDYTNMTWWRNQTRQLFILSDSGKPIYSRHGEEDKLVTLCGVMQALVSVINDTDGDNLWNLSAIGTSISFLVRTPLILVTVARTGETDRQLLIYLNYAYDFVISVLTLPQLTKIFKRHQNFDLRRMLAGTEKSLDHLIDWFDVDMGFLLGCVRCLPLPVSVRESINTHLTHSCQKIPGLVFAIVMVNRQLISITRLKKYVLHPGDIRLLINLIDASDSFKTAESWMPICLPKFDSSGFLHAYISYLRDSPVCLVYLGVDPQLFHTLAKSAASFSAKMDSSGDLNAVLTAMKTTSYYSTSQSGVAELRHFVYKSTSAAQLTSPFVTVPYASSDQAEKLREFYRYLHRRMHSPTRAAKIIVVTSNTEMLLGWVTSGFELYAVLEPFLSKHHAVLAIEKLIKWIKKEENHLFILNSPVFT